MDAPQKPGISLVLPVCNHAGIIRQVLRDAAAALARFSAEYELVVVDYGSTDSTPDRVQEETRHNPAIRFISLSEEQGYGAALRTGLNAATKPLVAYAEASGSIDFEQFDCLLLLVARHGVAGGYRLETHAPWRQRLYESCYSLLARLLLRTGSRDCNCAFKLIRREVLNELSLRANDALIHAELLAQARLRGHSVVEVCVTQRPVWGGTNSMPVVAMVLGLAALVRYWWSAIQFPSAAQQPATSVRAAAAAKQPSGASIATGLVCLVLIAAPVLLLNLSYPFFEPDENRSAQIGMEMFQSGDYLLPTRHGRPYLHKPPLLFWSISASYSVFGLNEWAARLPVALAALLTVVSTYLMGRNAVGNRAAWLGAVVLLLSGGFVFFGRLLVMDAVLTLFTTVALLAAQAGAKSPRYRDGWWFLAGLACGLGVLVKGPVALVIVVPPLLASLWLARETFSAGWRELLLFVGTSLVLAAPWYVAVSLRDGDFLSEFLWKHNVQRYTNAFDHEQPWWFYIPVLFLAMWPASVLFPGLVVFLTSRRAGMRELRTPGIGYLVLAAGWILLFFSLSSSKLPTYILPAFPPLCLLLGSYIDTALIPSVAGRTAILDGHLQAISKKLLPCAAIAIALGGLIAVASDALLGNDTTAGYLIAGVIAALSVALIVGVFSSAWQRRLSGWSPLACSALVMMAYVFNDVCPEIAERRSKLLQAIPEVAAARERARREGIPVAFYGALGESASFYMDDRGVLKFAKDDRPLLLSFAKEHPRMLVLANSSNARMVERNLPPAYTFQRQPDAQFLFELSRSPAESSLVRHSDRTARK